jgi:hypothetical protein
MRGKKATTCGSGTPTRCAVPFGPLFSMADDLVQIMDVVRGDR